MIEKLQSPQGLEDTEAQKTVQEVEPVFNQLQDYLRQLAGGAAVPPRFASQVKATLRQMLELFRQPDNAAGRQELQARCDHLAKLDPGVEGWSGLLKTVTLALGNRSASYKTLAPVVIKEIKQASDAIVANRGHEVSPSAILIGLAGTPTADSAASASSALPGDPKAIVKLLIESLDRKQLIQVAQILVRYLKSA